MNARPTGPVVVGVDGSANSRHALLEAGSHAVALGVPLLAVHAVGLTDIVAGEHITAFGHRDDIRRAAEAWCAELGTLDLDVVVELIDGPPVDVLLRTARDRDACLIVVGRRGAGGRPELLIGSTAHQIVERSHRPVLVVPPIVEADQADGGEPA